MFSSDSWANRVRPTDVASHRQRQPAQERWIDITGIISQRMSGGHRVGTRRMVNLHTVLGPALSMAEHTESAICAYCNQLVTVFSLHSVTVTSPPPDRKGARPRDHGVGIRVRRTRCSPDPCPAAGSVMVAGLPRGEIGLFLPSTRQRLGRLAPVWLPTSRKGVGIRTLSCTPTRLERGTYCLGVHFVAGTDRDAPSSQTVPRAF